MSRGETPTETESAADAAKKLSYMAGILPGAFFWASGYRAGIYPESTGIYLSVGAGLILLYGVSRAVESAVLNPDE